MGTEYEKGYAFIFEGDTEKEFYMVLLQYLCNKYSASFTRILDEKEPDIAYELMTELGISVVKFHTVNAITQMPRAGDWFKASCVNKYKNKCEWSVFLCYDQDSNDECISKFNSGDWETLSNDLKRAGRIIDMAASADIEDIMLEDLENICAYLGCDVPESLKGRKGKVKIKNLFRDNGSFYHEGERARPIIEALNMEYLIQASKLPLQEVENVIFK